MSKPSRKRKNPLVTSRRNLVPHTPAWFRELRRIDPKKAAITNASVERTGQVDGCSICGDTPAPTFELVSEPWLPLRLCADCVEIRVRFYGEHYQRRDATPRNR